MSPLADRLLGALLGAAVGDAIGLPYEGIGPRRVARLAPPALGHRMWLGRGMVSDDTEHAAITLWALRQPGPFGAALARGLRRWFLAAPPGIGLATLRSCAKLCLGVSPDRSGVWSAGNGPAMRAPVIGVLSEAADLPGQIAISTRITHTDPQAEAGAFALALAAHLSARRSPDAPIRPLFDAVCQAVVDPALSTALAAVAAALDADEDPAALAARLGLGTDGVTGYMLHTAPVALFLWARDTDMRTAITDAVRLGGYTDSVAAVVGALIGARRGAAGVPVDWLAGIVDWPWSPARLRALVEGTRPDLPAMLPCFLRNVFVFGPIAILHVVRRLFPPW